MCRLSAAIETDVLVVGLGPAGASAAIAAAKAGFTVTALERNASPGVPVQCAEFVPLLIGSDTGRGLVAEAAVQAISAMETCIENESADITLDFRGQIIDRAKFDRKLVEQARDKGVECLYSTPLKRILPDGVVETSTDRRYRAKVIIGADGPRSPVGAAIGSKNTELVETRQITVALTEAHDATDIFLSADIPGGYGWLFPKGDVANLGLGVVPEHKSLLKPALEKLHGRLVNEGRAGEDILSYTGGLIPVGGILNAEGGLGESLVLLAGDAAGLTNPVTGAGINSAVISGRLAGEAAAGWLNGNSHAGADYSEEIEELFGPSINRARFRRQEIMATYSAGKRPEPGNLRMGWIAYPEYWAPLNSPGRSHETPQMRQSA